MLIGRISPNRETDPHFPVSAPPNKVYRIDNSTYLVLFFASHPYPQNSSEVGPSTAATLSALKYFSAGIGNSSLPVQFSGTYPSVKGDVKAVIEIIDNDYGCDRDIALAGVGFWGSIVVQDKTRPSFSFHVIRLGRRKLCTVHVDVNLAKGGITPVGSMPASSVRDMEQH